MKVTEYENLSALQAVKISVNELAPFLDGWGEFERVKIRQETQNIEHDIVIKFTIEAMPKMED